MAEVALERFGVHDFRLEADAGQANPFTIELSATFRHESGQEIRNLPGFYDGDCTYVIRFSPTLEGAWMGITRSPLAGLDKVELGPVRCTACTNPALHGRVRVDPRYPRRFVFEDGTPLVALGYEFDWTAAFHQRLGQPKGQPVDRADDRFSAALDLIAANGFNYVVTNLYAHEGFSDKALPWVFSPPELFPWEGANESPDHSRFNVAFWRDYDQVVEAFHRRGLVMHLMLQVQNKKVKWPKRRSAEDDRFWRYVVARYQAYCNVVWDVSKETFKIKRSVEDHIAYATERMAIIRAADAYTHLLTAHDAALEVAAMTDADHAADFITDQTHLRGRSTATATLDIAWRYYRESARRFRRFAKPYLNVEYGYELPPADQSIKTFADAQSVEWPAMLLWTYAILAGGAYPNYYYNNTAWDLVKFDPVPESWRRYRYLADFLGRMDLGPMAPDREYSQRGMCLAQAGRQYYVLLPEGGDDWLDLSAVSEGSTPEAAWMDIYTGQCVTAGIEKCRFQTHLKNPLDNPAHPCAIYIRAAGG